MKYKEEFDALTLFLDDQIKKYLDAASGGELRHLRHHSTFHSSLEDYLTQTTAGERWSAWIRWKQEREKHGVEALKEARRLFATGDWKSSYGGKTWAKVTDLLISRLIGEFSEIPFIDTAFSIDHNTGCVFNKLWNVDGQKQVYKYAFNGDMKNLIKTMNGHGMEIK